MSVIGSIVVEFVFLPIRYGDSEVFGLDIAVELLRSRSYLAGPVE